MIPHNQSASDSRRPDAREPRIAILVLGCLLTVYERCIKTIRATWGAKSVDNVDIFYVYGGQNTKTSEEIGDIEHLIGRPVPQLQNGEVWVSGDIILCGAADVFEGQRNCVLRKRLIAFGYLANQQRYDFVHTVCAASYVDVDGLKRYVRNLPSTGVYQGALHVHEQSGYPFVSGASFLLSRDVAADLADSAEAIISAYPDRMPDDVAIGHFIANKYCSESIADIARGIASGRKPTDNQLFVLPHDMASLDFVMAPAYSQVPHEHAYHFHFHSRRMWEMENFHRRFFAT
ncbi:MAG TPA: hypothetical protein VFG30_13140 [Polyangiales bacterium]|nr:hypothetical protein [Polyangiales bacterium]